MAELTLYQMKTALMNAHNAGDMESARLIAEGIKQREARLPKDTSESLDPTKDMSWGGKFVAGYGKASMDAYNGIKQALPDSVSNLLPGGVVTRADIDESRRLDAPLMKTGAGMAGNIANNIAMIAPTALIPGANTVLGSVLVGGALGAIQPVGEKDSRIYNSIQGGALGGAFPAAVAAGKIAKSAVIDPFREKGREQIAGRILQRFAEDPTKIQNAPSVWGSGAKPTLAEATGDNGLAQLQRTVMTQDPQIANAISTRMADNNAARIGALQDIAGSPASRAAAEAARQGSAGQMYRAAVNATYTMDDQLAALLNTPAMKQAAARAKTLAENQQRPFTFAVESASPFSGVGGPQSQTTKQITGQGLQDLKMAMDEMLTDPASGFTGKAGKALESLRGKLINWMETANPDFKAARVSYRDQSRPINQMDIGQRLLDTTTSTMRDFSGNNKLYGNAFGRALRNEEQTVKNATGMRQTLDEIMTPQQMTTLRGLEDELSKAAGWQSAGKVPGSPTAQYLMGQDILRQVSGPIGLPKSFMENALLENLGSRPLSWAYKAPEQKIVGLLGEAMTDPAAARRMLDAANKKGPVQTYLANHPRVKSSLEFAAAGVSVAPLGLIGLSSPTNR